MAPPSSGSGSRSLPIALSLLPALVLVLGLGVFVVANPGLRAEAVVAWDLLWEGEPDALRDWLLGFGAWAPVISGLLQFVTSIFPPGPSSSTRTW